eukprot:gene53909-49150_t
MRAAGTTVALLTAPGALLLLAVHLALVTVAPQCPTIPASTCDCGWAGAKGAACHTDDASQCWCACCCTWTASCGWQGGLGMGVFEPK